MATPVGLSLPQTYLHTKKIFFPPIKPQQWTTIQQLARFLRTNTYQSTRRLGRQIGRQTERLIKWNIARRSGAVGKRGATKQINIIDGCPGNVSHDWWCLSARFVLEVVVVVKKKVLSKRAKDWKLNRWNEGALFEALICCGWQFFGGGKTKTLRGSITIESGIQSLVAVVVVVVV